MKYGQPSVEILFFKKNCFILQYHIDGVLMKTVHNEMKYEMNHEMKYDIIYP